MFREIDAQDLMIGQEISYGDSLYIVETVKRDGFNVYVTCEGGSTFDFGAFDPVMVRR